MSNYHFVHHPGFQRYTASHGDIDQPRGHCKAWKIGHVEIKPQSGGFICLVAAILMASGISCHVGARILSITIPRVGAPKACPLVMGTARNPRGDILSINRQ